MFDLISVKYSEDVGLFREKKKKKLLRIVYKDDKWIEIKKL